jgi:uncharacterized membrane protein YesL
MKIFNSGLFQTLNAVVDLFLLNFLWFITSLPLITFFPATAALFGVVRKRIIQNETDGMFKNFFAMFKENFKQSSILSALWTVIGIFLLFDYRLIQPEASIFHLVLYIILVIGILLFCSITIYLFPIMVHFELNWKLIIRNAFFFSLMNPVLTILLLVIVGVCFTLIYHYPITILFLGSFTAYAVYYLCQIWFNQVLDLKKSNRNLR